MNLEIFYCIIAILVIAVVALLLRPGLASDDSGDSTLPETAKGMWENQGLNLAERILDPADYLWLRDQLGFPTLAESLRRHRKQLALQWLSALRGSFGEVVRSADPASHSSAGEEAWDSWRLLRMTLRFHLLLIYATLVVRYFGPYHRLIPSLDWMEMPWGALTQRPIGRNTSVKRSV
ncbi:MAG: hypothetical protein ACE145_15840 [Terriglobia bacterium]